MAVWAAEELRQLLESVCGERLVIGWLAATGIRRSEVLGLR